MFIELIEMETKKNILINLQNVSSMEFFKVEETLKIMVGNKEYEFGCDEDLYKELKKKLHIIL